MLTPPTPLTEGHCGVTAFTPPIACETLSQGSFQLKSAAACVRTCLSQCRRCLFVSFSKATEDCSWYEACDTSRLEPAAGYETYDLSKGYEDFFKLTPVSDPFEAAARREAKRLRAARSPRADLRHSLRPEPTWPAVPRDWQEKVDLSILVQFWAARCGASCQPYETTRRLPRRPRMAPVLPPQPARSSSAVLERSSLRLIPWAFSATWQSARWRPASRSSCC